MNDLQKPTGERGAGYVRVSHGEKQDPKSQREVMEAWTDKRGKSVARWYADVEGRNPRDKADERREFQRLMRDVEAGQWDWVVVASQDRFGVKDNAEWGYYVTILRRNDCELWSVQQNLCLSSMDDGTVFTTTVGNQTSKRELTEYGQRQIKGKRSKAAKGEWQGGYVPYGFDVVCLDENTGQERYRVVILKMVPTENIWHRVIVYPDGQQKRCDGKDTFPRKQDWEKFMLAPSIITERIDTMRDVFRLFASGSWSVRGLCTRLNQRHIDPVTGIGWYNTRLKPLLQNPVYYLGQTVWGKNSHGKNAWYVGGEFLIPPQRKGKATTGRKNQVTDWVYPAPGAAIIDKELWDEVQERLNSRKSAIKRGLRDERLWLSELLVCGRCGQKMSGWSLGGLTYCCSTYRKYGKANRTGCRLHRVSQSKIEEQVSRYLDDAHPDVKALLRSRDEPALLSELRKRFDERDAELFGVYEQMKEYLRAQGIAVPDKTEEGDGLDLLTLYKEAFERDKGKLEAELAEKRADLKACLANLNRLRQPEAVEMQQELIEEVGYGIRYLEARLTPLRERLDSVYDDLATLDRAFDGAKAALPGDDSRRKALALRKAVQSITLNFRHYEHKPKDRRTKAETLERSALETVAFAPVIGCTQTYAVDRPPGPD